MYLCPKYCWEKLEISNTSFQEIRYRLGYKGKKINIEQFNEIEKVVEDIKSQYGRVALSDINRYWKYVREEVQEDER